jgi:hypothetical protein
MDKRGFSSTFVKASTSSVAAALLNMLTTVLIVRWFGDHIYADYIVDLAVVSIILIVLEVVPSNFVVFKVQDDPKWINSAATHAVISVIFIILVTGSLGEFSSFFRKYTPWIAVYVALLAIKRFLDIRQQSTGNIAQFLRMEVYIALLRLLLFGVFFQNKIDPPITIWMSLALATATVQLVWFISHPEDREPFKKCVTADSIKSIINARANYPDYYIGVVLKRIRDNLMPLAADRFFQQKDELAAFFLAYRGLSFALSQIRIFESILNHRPALNAILGLSTKRMVFVAILAQIVAITVSTLILLISGANQVDPVVVIVLSVMVWPYTYLVLRRAQAYSQYQVKLLNTSLIGYIITLLVLCVCMMIFDIRTGVSYSIALIAAECLGLLILYMRSREKYD